MTPSYEYWASLSDYDPKLFLTEQQHQDWVFRRAGFDQPTLGARGRAFFAANSGLVPADNYTMTEHITAYFAAQSDAWESGLISSALSVYDYTPWVQQRRNLFNDPFGVGLNIATDWMASPGTLGSVDGSAFGRATAMRVSNPTNGAQRGGPKRGTNFGTDTLYTVRFRVRGSEERTNWQLSFRNTITTTTGSVVIATGLPIGATIRTYEYAFTSPSAVGSGSGIYLINTGGFTGEWFEMSDVEIEVGDKTGLGFIGPARTSETERVRFLGAENASNMVLETRSIPLP
jgi:hypothetical protein